MPSIRSSAARKPPARRADHHATMQRDFRWAVPADFNIAEACCGRWARSTPDAIAIHHDTESGPGASISYRELQRQANRLSRLLRSLGVQRGDRIAIVMPQRPETAIAHIAIHQLGAVAMPLAMLFGPDALEYRLQHSAACACDRRRKRDRQPAHGATPVPAAALCGRRRHRRRARRPRLARQPGRTAG